MVKKVGADPPYKRCNGGFHCRLEEIAPDTFSQVAARTTQELISYQNPGPSITTEYADLMVRDSPQVLMTQDMRGSDNWGKCKYN